MAIYGKIKKNNLRIVEGQICQYLIISRLRSDLGNSHKEKSVKSFTLKEEILVGVLTSILVRDIRAFV